MEKRVFREMLLEVSDKLSKENLDKLKFLCTDIGKKRLEKVSNGIELFECLMEKAEIGPDKTEPLRKLLKDISRTDLLEILDNYEGLATGRSDDVLDARERERIDAATEEIVPHLGRKWISVGRRLGLNHTQLEAIQEKHSRDLEEQVRELIRQWMKMKRENTRVEDLIKALRDCKQNLTADLVEKKLRSL